MAILLSLSRSMLTTSSLQETMICLLTNSSNKFFIKDLGKLKYFLGIEVHCSKNGIFISQRKYILYIFMDTGLIGGRVSHFPMEQHLRLSPGDGTLLPDPLLIIDWWDVLYTLLSHD